MNRINTGRQSHAAAHRNRNYRPSGRIASHVLAGTITDELFPVEQQVSCRIADQDFQVGALSISRSQVYYLVACTIAVGRYYVVVRGQGTWQCSIANDERLLAYLMVKVIEYRTAPVVVEEEDMAEVA